MCLPDRDGHALRERLGIGERPVVLFLGRRDESKGYPALLKAWSEVISRNPAAVLVLSGPGGFGYEALREALPADSFRDLGIADEETKARALSSCNVFCLPSAQESFGIVFAEAFSYGKPVVCGPAPASREWIENGLTGLHVDQNPRKISGAILELLADPHRAAAMGAAGRNFQQTHLSWDKTLASHMAAFQL
jgi:glycosyltransferase involved in cell wall biosynthesis